MKANRKIAVLTQELKDLTETLRRLDTGHVEAGAAILCRFIGQRIIEIATELYRLHRKEENLLPSW